MREYYVGAFSFSPDDIYHHGIKGQKWGVRRFVNPDGTLTPEGKRRYGTAENFYASKQGQKLAKQKQSLVSSRSKLGNLASKHKKGLAIAGGLLAAGAAAVIASKVIGSNSSKKGADICKSILTDKDGYSSKGTEFSIGTKKGNISGYYSPEYAKFMRKMNKGSLPGSHAKNFSSTTKALSEWGRRGLKKKYKNLF